MLVETATSEIRMNIKKGGQNSKFRAQSVRQCPTVMIAPLVREEDAFNCIFKSGATEPKCIATVLARL